LCVACFMTTGQCHDNGPRAWQNQPLRMHSCRR
jgi:hypothetical protein